MATAKKNTAITAADSLAAAEDLVTLREAGWNAAQLAQEELAERVDGGDDTVVALDLVLAAAEVERTGRLISSARQAVKRAAIVVEQEELQNSQTLAQWLLQLIERDPFAFGLQGMALSVGTPTNDAQAPAVFLSQRELTKVQASTGTMSGTVYLAVVLPAYVENWDHQPVANGVKRLIDDGTGVAERAYVTSRQQGRSPVVAIDIVNLKPEIPALPGETPGNAFRDFGFMVTDALRFAGTRVTHDSGDYRFGSSVSHSITATAKTVTLVGESTGGDLIRRRVSVIVEGASRHTGSDLLTRIKRAVDSLSSEIAPWLGRIESGSIGKVDSYSRMPGEAPTHARANKFTVTAEFVMVSTLA